ncbi:hypothetical protein K1T71_014483 [Dendrolimus kikuchii]|uniref:Uncharacterized protein n=1 Tax=Dendrolimus kikuchii TaxID=765133 RepID=A0ACC1CE80_9NEOP|nr:hypothetical protein K1T71_014483 [Dendrolimus kikuchii]
MDVNQKAFAELSSVFIQLMEVFESELRNVTPTTNISTLSTEFLSFKNLIFKSLKSFQNQMILMSHSIDNLEMRTRRKILLLHGVPEGKQEDTAALDTQVHFIQAAPYPAQVD